jgi:polyisoprenyl-teichoic acid--peptidoglycan teichoic acid transferase
MSPPQKPPTLGLSFLRRAALGALIIFALTTTTTATAVLLEVKGAADIFDRISVPIPGINEQGVLDDVDPGGPQTILVLGADRRYQDIKEKNPVRSDTMMLVRLDPSKGATAVMSIPRDLRVDIPGFGAWKINQAYALGGPKLSVKTVRQLLGIPINHVVNVHFGGFRRAVDRLECVYADVDRRYYHTNLGLPAYLQYAEIDVPAGYQKLCGQDALDYVRYRHGDNDFVRAARQQDFLRQAKDQFGVSKLFSDRRTLLQIFAHYAQTDIRGTDAILRLLKLIFESASHPIQEVTFPGEDGPNGEYVTVDPFRLDRAVYRFLNAKGSPGPRGDAEATKTAKQRAQRRQNRRRPPGVPPGLILAPAPGLEQAAALDARVDFPVYYPELMPVGGQYIQSDGRAYDIYDRSHQRYRAYRIVVNTGEVGQYFGVQGMTWKAPPVLDNPSERRRMAGRTYELFFDGDRLRLVAWRTPHAVYWVSNTLLHTLTNRQMLAIARSLTRSTAR